MTHRRPDRGFVARVRRTLRHEAVDKTCPACLEPIKAEDRKIVIHGHPYHRACALKRGGQR